MFTTHAPATLLLAAAAAVASPAFGDVEYELVIIEPWDSGYSLATSSASGLNNLNQVSGAAWRQSGPPQFLWTRETGKQSIDFAGQINDQGVIATGGAIRWPDGTVELFEWPMHGVGELNNANVIAGSSGAVHTCPKHPNREAVIWMPDGEIVRLDVEAGIFAADQAWGINEHNEVVGVRSSTGQCGDHKAFYYDVATDTFIDLHDVITGSPSGITRAYDINDAGTVVGDGPIDGLVRPFTWSIENGVTVLPTLAGADTQYSHPVSINDHGVIVGASLNFETFEWHATIWDERGARSLNDLVELPADFIIDEATKINDNGWIIGRGHYGAWSPERAVVLVPLERSVGGDLNGDFTVGMDDLLMLLASWGPCGESCPADLTGDGVVGFADVVSLLAAWS